jgi:hypothetical protein
LVGFGTSKVYSGMGADIVMESITPTTAGQGIYGLRIAFHQRPLKVSLIAQTKAFSAFSAQTSPTSAF